MPTVSLAHETTRYNSVLKSLELISDDVAKSIKGKKTILIKPNFVCDNSPLCATHVDTAKAIIDFLQQFSPQEIIIAESSSQSATRGFRNYNYHQLQRDYGIELIDMDYDDYKEVEIFTRRRQNSFGITHVRVAKTVIDADYRVSPAVLKTHDTVIVTLSLKNMVMGAVLDKQHMHQGYEAMNVNLYMIAKFIPVHLAVIDGWRGMEGNGPVSGTPVETRTVIASTDFIAADAVGTTLMGFTPSEIGYLQYASGKHGFQPLGSAELSQINVIGEPIGIVTRKFKPHYSYADQKHWHIPPTLLQRLVTNSLTHPNKPLNRHV